jgi:hypothetical protein
LTEDPVTVVVVDWSRDGVVVADAKTDLEHSWNVAHARAAAILVEAITKAPLRLSCGH